MSNFRFDYNDIHKQVAIADLTDEQIQELFTLLQTKRSARPQLTKEEKAFFQCCREHRSYANNKDTATVVCPHCGSVKSIKNGTKNGRQRYFCKDCHKTFGDTNGTVAFRSKLSVAQWIEKNKSRPYIEQAYDIITLLSNQSKKIPLAKFKHKPISFDLKGLLG